MTIEQWAAEMFRRAKDTRAARCLGCPSPDACSEIDTVADLCSLVRLAWHEAGVVPVVKALGERSKS